MSFHGKILKITRPTKIEFIRLRRRLVLARRVHRMLKDRLTLLVVEFFNAIRRCVELRTEIQREYNEILKLYTICVAKHGYSVLDSIANVCSTGVTVEISQRNIMGVIVPMIEIESLSSIPITKLGYTLTDTYPILEELIKRCRNLVRLCIELSEYEKSVLKLGSEIVRMRRKVNMLEHVIIPRLRATIRYIYMKFEERDRETKARLKRLKILMARRRISR